MNFCTNIDTNTNALSEFHTYTAIDTDTRRIANTDTDTEFLYQYRDQKITTDTYTKSLPV